MKVAGLSREVRVAILAAAAIAAVVVVFVLSRATPPKPPLPRTLLSFVGLSNLPPVGMMTAFSISNGSPGRLVYDQRVVEYRSSNQWVTVPSEEIVNRVGVLAPGGVYVFFIPALVTNRSLKIDMDCRGSAAGNGLLAKVEQLVSRASKGKLGAFLGGHCSGVITEVDH